MAHRVNSLICARILPNESSWVIRSRWSLVECMTTSPSQWRQQETVVWLALGDWRELLFIGRDELSKRCQNDFRRHSKHSYFQMWLVAVLIGQWLTLAGLLYTSCGLTLPRKNSSVFRKISAYSDNAKHLYRVDTHLSPSPVSTKTGHGNLHF